jgi:quercetin dioxygenase-like cupin family protein
MEPSRLSFAQFEREFTGERIRDKSATSRQKGMWMGGKPNRNDVTFAFAKRWCLWLAAYNDARIRELTSLRGSDVRLEGSIWVSRRQAWVSAFRKAKALLVMVRVPTGTKADRHSHPHEQFVQVVAGSGELETEQGAQAFGPGSVFHFPADTWHAARFDSDTILIETNLKA